MLKISLRSSWVLAAVLMAAHGVAIAIIMAIDVPLWVKAIILVALAASLFLTVRRSALLSTPDAAVAIEVSSDDVLSIQTRGGEWLECEVLGSTYVTSFLSILNLKQTDSGAIKRIVILPDSIDAEDFRKLRVWLRWKESSQPG